MQIFVAFDVGDKSVVMENIEENYAQNHHKADESFFIATTGETAKEVANKIGIGEEQDTWGIVISIDSYWGCYDAELWEWLEAKRSANGK